MFLKIDIFCKLVMEANSALMTSMVDVMATVYGCHGDIIVN